MLSRAAQRKKNKKIRGVAHFLLKGKQTRKEIENNKQKQ